MPRSPLRNPSRLSVRALFFLKPADGAIGAHPEAAHDCKEGLSAAGAPDRDIRIATSAYIPIYGFGGAYCPAIGGLWPAIT